MLPHPNPSFQLDDFVQDIEDIFLQPMLMDSDVYMIVDFSLVLNEALTWVNHPYDSSRRKQLLLCVTGEGGTGKSHPKAIVDAIDILGRKDEIILMVPTGAAADTIGGNTYHTSLAISINRLQKGAISSRIRRLWAHKTIMFIDEMGMMDLTMLSMINNHCRIARSLDRSSPDFLGGLPVVIPMGDFFQFPPVRGPALWKEVHESA